MAANAVRLAAIALCASAGFDLAGGQSLPHDLDGWQISYAVDGGIVGPSHRVTVSLDGRVTVFDLARQYNVAGQAPTELIGRMTSFLRRAHVAEGPTHPPSPDMPFSSLSVTSGDRTFEIDQSPEVDSLIADAANEAVRQSVVGTWRESAWALCRPVARQLPSDVDPPIDAFELRPNSTFAVTWRGGGAHTTGIPHVPVPDYSGRYSFSPSTGTIELQVVGGIVAPRDFAGSGHLGIKRDTLTLRNVWLGTRQAAHKPDICTITFVKN
jgi:hypothetical protein